MNILNLLAWGACSMIFQETDFRLGVSALFLPVHLATYITNEPKPHHRTDQFEELPCGVEAVKAYTFLTFDSGETKSTIFIYVPIYLSGDLAR